MIAADSTHAKYYARRAESIEQVYLKPERQADLSTLRQRLAEIMAGHRVLEVACGTGYWTQIYAPAAESVVATDINPPMLALAKAKGLDAGKVRWEMADAFHLPDLGPFTACLAAFWWSHVPREAQEGFLQELRRSLGKDTLLVLVDNAYVEGSSTTIARTDHHGNTFQIRTMPDGERIEVLKNFPSDSGLRKKLSVAANDIRILRLEYYWMLTCRLK